jgi:hypothetical protein
MRLHYLEFDPWLLLWQVKGANNNTCITCIFLIQSDSPLLDRHQTTCIKMVTLGLVHLYCKNWWPWLIICWIGTKLGIYVHFSTPIDFVVTMSKVKVKLDKVKVSTWFWGHNGTSQILILEIFAPIFRADLDVVLKMIDTC